MIRLAWLAIAAMAIVSPDPLAHDLLGPQGEPLPFDTREELVEFLETAEIVSAEELGGTSAEPLKVVLEKDGVRMHGVFRHVDKRMERIRYKGRFYKELSDSCFFEPAAYRLSRLLGLDLVPPAVERVYRGQRGSLQAWVEGTMTETERIEEGLVPPDDRRWRHQKNAMRVFDNLVFNADRNTGNILVDADWNLWLVDHTRAFQRVEELRNPLEVMRIDRTLWRRLQELDRETLDTELGPYLSPFEIADLLVRRDLLVEHIRSLVAQRGEAVVFFDTADERLARSD